MTRLLPASITLAGVFGIVLLDWVVTPANPYQAPPILALGSGLTTSGGFCGALPN